MAVYVSPRGRSSGRALPPCSAKPSPPSERIRAKQTAQNKHSSHNKEVKSNHSKSHEKNGEEMIMISVKRYQPKATVYKTERSMSHSHQLFVAISLKERPLDTTQHTVQKKSKREGKKESNHMCLPFPQPIKQSHCG